MAIFKYKPDPQLIQFATPNEREVLEAGLALGTYEGVREKLGLTGDQLTNRVSRLQRRATQRGYVPEHGLTEPLPEGMRLERATIQRGADGRVERTWSKGAESRDAAMQHFIDAVERAGESCAGIAGVTEPPPMQRQDLLALYGAGDPHFGMQAWHKVAGGNWDLKIAERTLLESLAMLAAAAPPAAEAIFLNAGDMFHADNDTARTPASGHALDVDNRWPKVLDVILRTHMQLAKILLQKHNTLRIIALPGNHDPQSTMVLQVCLKLMFQDEPRITIDTEKHLYTRYLFGAGLLGFHHGHGLKPADLPLYFATKYSQDWAAAVERHIYTGHLHTEIARGYMGTVVETLPTLAAGDKYSADNFGALAQRSMICDTWHRERGKVQRNKVHIRHLNQERL